jgi:hypothetical protein
MSTQALSWVFDHSKTEGVARLVMIGIANHVDRRGDGWAYVDEVRRVAKCSLNSYHRAVKAAIELGELEVDVRGGGRLEMRGGYRPNRYVFPLMSCGTQPGEDTESCGTHGGEVCGPQPGEVGPTQPGEDTPAHIRNDPSLTHQGPGSLTLVGVSELQDSSFSEFWTSYPRRNGKRLGKPEAENAWKRMTRGERTAALTGTTHYAEAVDGGLTFAKDAHRWLKGRCWVDWQEPAESAWRPPGVPADAVCIDGTWVY